MENIKTCSSCGLVGDKEFFGKNKSICKNCMIEYKKNRKNREIFCSEFIRNNFAYDALSGLVYKIITPNKNIGTIDAATGYIRITIGFNGKKYRFYAHRLAWFLYKGYFPEDLIDHIDHNKLNNKIENLRECTSSQNGGNILKKLTLTSCYKGVCYSNEKEKFQAYISINRKQKFLGSFESEKEAAEAYNKEAKRLFGEHANLNIIL